MSEKTCFKIVVPSFNSVQYLPKTLKSIESQRYGGEWEVCIVDDASTLEKQREIISSFCTRNGWKALYHNENTGALYSLLDGITHLHPDDEDVILVVDGDDWLAHDQVLARLDSYYSQDRQLAITWGQYEEHPKGWLPVRYAHPVPSEVVEVNSWRDQPWVFWHPHTFKYFLWKAIRDEDLRDREGEYFRISGDQAFMFPMLEMAGSRGRYIDEILYVYNIDNPLNDFKISRAEQAEATAYIRSQKRYQPWGKLSDEDSSPR